MKKSIEILKKKWLRETVLTMVLVIIIILIYMGINALASKVTIPDLDLTKSKIYSLSDETKNKIKDIDKEVKITLINMENYDDNYVINYANKYSEINSKISIDKVDNLSARADLMTKYSIEESTSEIIVECNKKEKMLGIDDLYTYEYTNNSYEVVNKIEEALTNAILDVTTENKPQIYLYNVHSSYSEKYFTTLSESIKNDANEFKTLDLLASGKVPEDCSCLIIPTPTEDISEEEKSYLINYINNGGNIMLLQDANILKTNTPNFQSVLDMYGFSVSEGVVMEQDENKMVYNMPGFVITDVGTYTSLTKKLNMNLTMCLMDPGKIEFKDSGTLENLGISYEILAQASEKAFLRNDLNISDYKKTESDQDASNAILGALVTKKINDEKSSKLIVYSNAIFSTNMSISMSNSSMSAISFYNNEDMVVNSINYLAEKENSITIRKKYGDTVKFTVTEKQNRIILQIIYGIPLLIILIGFIVWRIRRNKK